MLPEEKARVKIDKQLRNAGWDVVSRNEYLPNSTTAVKEALMVGNTESDYLLFVDRKAIAVVEAKREDNNPLGDDVKKQVEDYAVSPQSWYALWFVPSVNKRFFQYYFDANLKKAAQEESNGSAIKNIPPFDVMKNWYFPLAPLSEQERIVEKIEELLALI
jgi:hypothetical protein